MPFDLSCLLYIIVSKALFFYSQMEAFPPFFGLFPVLSYKSASPKTYTRVSDTVYEVQQDVQYRYDLPMCGNSITLTKKPQNFSP